MSVCIVENENSENGLNCFFLDLKTSLPFSLVHLGTVLVHSDPIFCTFTFDFVQNPRDFVHLVIVAVHLHLCTIGSFSCTYGLYLCTLAHIPCTNGSRLCTIGGN